MERGRSYREWRLKWGAEAGRRGRASMWQGIWRWATVADTGLDGILVESWIAPKCLW